MPHIIDRLKNFFRNHNPSNRDIRIINRNDAGSPNTRPSNSGRITIQRVNDRTPTGGYRQEIQVTNPNLSGGIRIAHQRKPTTCPMCRTSGSIVENTGGTHKWRCRTCQHTF